MHPLSPLVPVPSRNAASGMPAWAIVLIVLCITGVVGGGGCVALVFAGVLLSDKHEENARVTGSGSAHVPIGNSPIEALQPDSDDEDEPESVPAAATQARNPPANPAIPPPAPRSNGSVCTASGSFRACGFAGVCGPRTASGVGVGVNEAMARSAALADCRSSASSMGSNGSDMCMITSCRAQ